MNRTTRAVLRAAAVLAAIAALDVFWQAYGWRRERDAQCALARPFVDARARIDDLRRLPAGRLAEYDDDNVDVLFRSFGPNSDKGKSIRQYLHRGHRALLFHRDSSVMLVYFDADRQAFNAECFLQ